MADSWRDSLPDDLKNEATLKDFKDPASLAKSYVEARSLLGNAVRVPGPQASDDDRAAFRAKLREKVPDLVEIPKDPEQFAKLEGELFERLGRPKDPVQYAEKFEGLDDDTLEALRKEAHEEGLTKKQFEARAKKVVDRMTSATAAEKAELALLKKELGEAYDERVSAAKAIAEKLGVPKDVLDQMPARQLRVFANAAKAIGSEGSEFGKQGPGQSGKLTPAELNMRAMEIRTRLYKESNLDNDMRQALLSQLIDIDARVAAALEQS